MKTDNLYEQTTHKGYYINIYYDKNTKFPLRGGTMGTIYTTRRLCRTEKDFGAYFNMALVFECNSGNFSAEFLDEYVALPIYLYDHGEKTVSAVPFSGPGDGSLFGIIAVGVDDVRKEYGWTRISKKRRRRIEERLSREVKMYDDYLKGHVYRYEINHKDNPLETVHRGGGFFGDNGLKHLKDECLSVINSLLLKKSL